MHSLAKNILPYQFLAALIAILINIFFPEFAENSRYVLLVVVILLVGMPHGALDHIITYQMKEWSDKPAKKPLFYMYYLGLMGIYIFFWILFPLFSMLVFLLITLFHFGQADAERFNANTWKKYTLLFSRGLTVVGLIVFADTLYASTVIESVTDFNLYVFISSYIEPASIKYFLAGFYPLAYLLLSFFMNQSAKDRLLGMMDALLVSALFLYCDVVWAFSIYFGVWHSYPHIRVMLDYLKSKREKVSFSWFFKESFPFSLLSYLGILFIYNLLEAFGNEYLMISLLFVAISVLTLPHMTIVHALYNKKSGRSRFSES